MALMNETPEKAEHIRALNAVNSDVATLLQTAGTAIKHLTTPAEADSATFSDAFIARKEAFHTQTTIFFQLFQKIERNLSAEADALEAAKLIPSEPPTDAKMIVKDEEITNGGLGKFDIGWLNSRGDGVTMGKEKELWEEARKILERMEGRNDREEERNEENEKEESDGN